MARPTKIKWLLDELCSRLGLCLSADERARIERDPPANVEAFAHAVLTAYGMDPQDKSNRKLGGQVRELIIKHLKPREGENAV